MAETRPRSALSPSYLAALLRPRVLAASWLKYDESENLKDAKVIQHEILRHRELLGELWEKKSLTLTKKVTHKAFDLLAQENDFGLSHDDLEDWKETMTRRLRCMCKATAQMERKTRRPGRAEGLPWLVSGGSTEPVKATKVGTEIFFAGFDRDIMQAWRQIPGAAAKEPSIKIRIPESTGAASTQRRTTSWRSSGRRTEG